MPFLSISVTAWPSRASASAAAVPVMPPPMMTIGFIVARPRSYNRGIVKRTTDPADEGSSASHEPYWWDAAPRERPTDVALPQRCDVAIVGAGYAGLAAAS